MFTLNEEFLVIASHYLALNTSLLFVHTARRLYRLDGPVSLLDVADVCLRMSVVKDRQILSSRGIRSRNKVSVGEPADGSFAFFVWRYFCVSAAGVFAGRFCALCPVPQPQTYNKIHVIIIKKQFLAMDVLVLIMMKNAAKCDNYLELQFLRRVRF